MKKIKILLIVFITYYMGISSVYSYFNNRGVKIEEDIENKLINLGFSKNEIMNLSEDEVNENIILNGNLVSKNIETYYLDFDEGIMPNAISNGNTSTEYKQMTTTISKLSNGKFRVKNTLVWKKIPKVRSYDIIGIGHLSNVKKSSDIKYKITYCVSNDCSSDSTNGNIFSSATGSTVTFKVPNSNITTLEIYMYYEIGKNTNSIIKQLNIYGDYSHATSSVTKLNAAKHKINTSGILLDSSIENSYDSINCSVAKWTGNW